MRFRGLIGTAAAGAAVVGYAAVVERNWFVLRRYDVPVLPPGSPTLRLLHLSDAHLTHGRHRLMSWIRSLDALDLLVQELLDAEMLAALAAECRFCVS